jgi:hypothetical protein
VSQHLVGSWNCVYTFVQEGADWKAMMFYGAAFGNILLGFNVTVSSVGLMNEG